MFDSVKISSQELFVWMDIVGLLCKKKQKTDEACKNIRFSTVDKCLVVLVGKFLFNKKKKIKRLTSIKNKSA